MKALRNIRKRRVSLVESERVLSLKVQFHALVTEQSLEETLIQECFFRLSNEIVHGVVDDCR